MEYLLFTVNLFIFAWIVTKIKFFKGAGLNSSQIIIIYLLKVMAGIVYGWVGIYYGETAMMVDTWGYHYLGLQEYKLLQTHPVQYLSDFFKSSFDGGFLNFLTAKNSFWNDLKTRSIVKMLSFFNVLSLGNYYTNVIFYSFLSLFGPVSVYRVMKDVFPGKNIQVGIATFLIPSFLYWSSGIHKEGLIFTGIGIIVYSFYFSLKEGRFKPKRIFLIIAGLLMLTILRNFLLIIIIPALVAWFVASKFPEKPLRVFSSAYLLFIFIFFISKNINPHLDFPSIVATKQKEFLSMYGGSMVPVKELQPDASGFVMALPQAITLSVLRPYPTDVIHLLSLTATIEIDFLLLLFILFLFFRTKVQFDKKFIYFCLFFSFTTLLSIGYTVNFIGAIVRYRSVILPFLVAPTVALTDWNKIARLFKTKGKT